MNQVGGRSHRHSTVESGLQGPDEGGGRWRSRDVDTKKRCQNGGEADWWYFLAQGSLNIAMCDGFHNRATAALSFDSTVPKASQEPALPELFLLRRTRLEKSII